jgi:hypothetical protein
MQFRQPPFSYLSPDTAIVHLPLRRLAIINLSQLNSDVSGPTLPSDQLFKRRLLFLRMGSLLYDPIYARHSGQEVSDLSPDLMAALYTNVNRDSYLPALARRLPDDSSTREGWTIPP